MLLDDKLSYEHHLKSVLNKVKKTTDSQLSLLRQYLSTIYKSFIRLHLEYTNIVYDRAFNESFHKNLESIQYNAVRVTTGTIRATSSKELFQELELESLRSRRWLRKLCLFYKLIMKSFPSIFSS